MSRRAAAVLAACLAQAGIAAAAVDLGGVWLGAPQPRSSTGTYLGISFDPRTAPGAADEPPLTAEYAAKFKAALDARRAGTPFPDPTAGCLPGGMPRMMGVTPFPMEILMTPGKVTMIFEWMSQVRHVYLDGRGHPEPDQLEPSFNGHSIGRWEGDTLVVDTIGLRADTLISQQGLAHSDALRVVERFRLSDGKLQNEITLIDPKAFTRPWTVLKTYTRQPKDVELGEYVCQEGVQRRPAGR